MADIGTPILSLPIATLLDGTEWLPLDQGGTTKRAQSNDIALGTVTTVFPAGIDYVMSGGAATVPTGVNGTGVVVPFDCSIASVTLNGNSAAGSIVVDVWKCTETQFDGGVTHPVAGDSITGSAVPAIIAGSKYTDTTLTGWNKTLTTGDVLWFAVSAPASFTAVTIALKVSRVLP